VSDHPILSKLATDRLRDDVAEPAPPPPELRDRSIGILAVAIAEQARKRRNKRIALFAAIAVAASAVGVVSVKLLHRPAPSAQAIRVVAHPNGPVRVVHQGTVTNLAVGAVLVDGDRLQTSAEAHASVVLSTGTHVEVDPASELTIASTTTDQVFVSTAGASKFSVAKLAPGERFLVRTSDTEVEVRGTIFRVALAREACAGTLTRVEVTEGTVVVRHDGSEVRVGKGDQWPHGCFAALATVEPSPTPSALDVKGESVGVAPLHPVSEKAAPRHPVVVGPPSVSALPVSAPPVSAPSVSAPSVTTPASELAEQNDLFAEGLAKKRAGDKIGAALTFERFLARWPSSTLAESAAVERMRVLSGEPARAAAKDYLARFPKGSARAEAEALAN
jgi:ferric-dicitrate binding protein FerR (iron transport regulator)